MTEAADPAAAIAALLADAACHIADALPELMILTRGGEHFERRLRPYLNEVTHCLASALEAALEASADAEAQLGIADRRVGEDAMRTAARTYLDVAAA
ncbi:hypothetical protein MOP88_14100 [Sphingomonas sp. WKB10]|nr:hypothetical protein [Sphingomonas sp. WKB10]